MPAEDKLRRYTAKDYSEVVEFPVELVDRDGVVRRYNYDESVGVYLRRIASAPWRYSDDSVVAAEVDHCNKRIDQLRRSYLLRCKSIGARVAPGRLDEEQRILGEAVNLLHEILGERLPRLRVVRGVVDDLGLVLDVVTEEDVPAVYHVAVTDGPERFLLYVFPKGDADGAAAAAFESQRRILDAPALAREERFERLVLARRGELADVLITERLGTADGGRDRADTVTGDEIPALDDTSRPPWWRRREEEQQSPPGATEFSAGLVALRRRDGPDAVRHFKAAIEANPYHREAYLALATMLDSLGQVEEGGLYSAMAVAYLPSDGLIRFNHGLNLLRRHRRAEALEVFEEAIACDATLFQPHFFAGLIRAMDGQLVAAQGHLETAVALATGEDGPRIEAALRWVVQRRRARRIAAGVAGSLGVLGLLLGAGGALGASGAGSIAVVALVASVLVVAVHQALGRRAARRLTRSIGGLRGMAGGLPVAMKGASRGAQPLRADRPDRR